MSESKRFIPESGSDQKKLMRERWDEVDQDKLGTIDPPEFRDMLLNYGMIEKDLEPEKQMEIAKEEIDRAEGWFETTVSDKKLTYSEFTIYFQKFVAFVESNKLSTASPAAAFRGFRAFYDQSGADDVVEEDLVTSAEDREAEIRTMFDLYDTDGSGSMEFAELKNLVVTLEMVPKDSKEVDKLVKEEMENAEKAAGSTEFDGKLSFQEFVHVYNRFVSYMKRDSEKARLAEEQAIIRKFSTGISSGDVKPKDMVKQFCSDDVELDEPLGWAGFGGVKGKEMVTQILDEDKAERSGDNLVFDLDSVQTAGSYIRQTVGSQPRKIYLYELKFTAHGGGQCGKVVFGMLEGSRKITEMCFHEGC